MTYDLIKCSFLQSMASPAQCFFRFQSADQFHRDQISPFSQLTSIDVGSIPERRVNLQIKRSQKCKWL